MEDKVAVAEALIDVVETMIAEPSKRENLFKVCAIIIKHYKSIDQ